MSGFWAREMMGKKDNCKSCKCYGLFQGSSFSIEEEKIFTGYRKQPVTKRIHSFGVFFFQFFSVFWSLGTKLVYYVQIASQKPFIELLLWSLIEFGLRLFAFIANGFCSEFFWISFPANSEIRWQAMFQFQMSSVDFNCHWPHKVELTILTVEIYRNMKWQLFKKSLLYT